MNYEKCMSLNWDAPKKMTISPALSSLLFEDLVDVTELERGCVN